MADEDDEAPQRHGHAQGGQEGIEQAVDHQCLGNSGAVDAEDAHQDGQQGEAHLAGRADEGFQQLQHGVKGAGLGDEVQEGVEQQEHEEQPHHLAAALHHVVENLADGHFGKHAGNEGGHDHNQDHVGRAALGDDAVDHHEGHGHDKGDGGVLGGAVQLVILGYGFHVGAEVLLALGVLLDLLGNEIGAHPHHNGNRQTGAQQQAGVGQSGDAHQRHHGGREGAEEQARLTGALEDDGQGGGGDAHGGHQGDDDGGDDGVGACQGAQQGDQHHGADHGGEDGPLLGLDADLTHEDVDDGGGYAGLAQHHAQAGAQHDDKAHQSQERAHGLIDHGAQLAQRLLDHDGAHQGADTHVHQRVHALFEGQHDV